MEITIVNIGIELSFKIAYSDIACGIDYPHFHATRHLDAIGGVDFYAREGFFDPQVFAEPRGKSPGGSRNAFGDGYGSQHFRYFLRRFRFYGHDSADGAEGVCCLANFDIAVAIDYDHFFHAVLGKGSVVFFFIFGGIKGCRPTKEDGY